MIAASGWDPHLKKTFSDLAIATEAPLARSDYLTLSAPVRPRFGKLGKFPCCGS